MRYDDQQTMIQHAEQRARAVTEQAHAAQLAANEARRAAGEQVNAFTLAGYYAAQAALSYARSAQRQAARVRDHLNMHHAETLRAEHEPHDCAPAELAAANAEESAHICADLAAYNANAAEQAALVSGRMLAVSQTDAAPA